MLFQSYIVKERYIKHIKTDIFQMVRGGESSLCKTWKMVAVRLQNDADFMQPQSHKVL